MNNPVAAVWDALDRHMGNEPLESLQVACQEKGILLAPDYQRRDVHPQCRKITAGSPSSLSFMRVLGGAAQYKPFFMNVFIVLLLC